MIRYVGSIYRPPSEARSLILQATIGCSHNRCAFCVAYQGKKFRARREEQLFADMDFAGEAYPQTRRVFLADGDAFVLSPSRMLRILERLYSRLPRLERVSAYASPQNIAAKTDRDLRDIRQAGLQLLYLGLESGDDEVLGRIQKGASSAEMIETARRAQDAGFDLSVTVILGLAGPDGSARHARATARVLDAIRPRWAAALTLMLAPRRPSYQEIWGDPGWQPLDAAESLLECRLLIENMQADGVTFRSNHASNYVALAGDLQRDKSRLLQTIDRALSDPASPLWRPEFMRAL